MHNNDIYARFIAYCRLPIDYDTRKMKENITSNVKILSYNFLTVARTNIEEIYSITVSPLNIVITTMNFS